MIANVAQLLVDDMEIIDQPFGCGGNCALRPDRVGNGPVSCQEHASIFFHPRRELASLGRVLRYALLGGERFRVLLKTLNAKNFSAYGLLKLAKSGK